MPPLDNPRHEQFVQNLVKPGAPSYLNLTKSYKETYPVAQQESANANGSRLIRDASVHDRFIELMEQSGLNDDLAVRKHKELIEGDDGNLIYKGVRMYHELKGRLSQARDSVTQIVGAVNVQINIGNDAQ